MEAKELAELAAAHVGAEEELRNKGLVSAADARSLDASAAALASIALTLSGSHVKVFIKNK